MRNYRQNIYWGGRNNFFSCPKNLNQKADGEERKSFSHFSMRDDTQDGIFTNIKLTLTFRKKSSFRDIGHGNIFHDIGTNTCCWSLPEYVGSGGSAKVKLGIHVQLRRFVRLKANVTNEGSMGCKTINSLRPLPTSLSISSTHCCPDLQGRRCVDACDRRRQHEHANRIGDQCRSHLTGNSVQTSSISSRQSSTSG